MQKTAAQDMQPDSLAGDTLFTIDISFSGPGPELVGIPGATPLPGITGANLEETALRTSVVFTFIGEDKPGLIETISEVVASHEGNWLDSRMSQLAGKFAGIIQVGVDDIQVADLTAALKALESTALSVLIEESDTESAGEPTKILQLHLLGLDRPGIVHEVSQALASQAINVAEMSTNVTTAAMTGELLFNAEASIEVPQSVDLDLLEEQLARIGNELAVDIDLILNHE